MFNYNPFDFTLTSSIYDLEELAAIVIQARGNFGAIENNTITTHSTSFNQPLVLTSEIFCLLLCANPGVQSNVFFCDSNTIRY